MDENKLSNILQEPNEFQVPQQTEEEHKIVFGEAAKHSDENISEDSDKQYDTEDEEEISLEEDDKDGKKGDNQGRRRTGRVRVLPQRWQHLQARFEQTEE